ncbi:MAG: ArsJ-associated glyceraldehyde-3-phosphate dehydrogenase [Pseudomonadota bacterium]|nr:ArsJ-associated glyceraldehyde-3-phosphate dehydrogenase [Pseudomonadota bacterium]
MKKRIAVNGFGRIGRLAVRLAHAFDDLEVVHVNEMAGDLEMAAHLLEFDSVHGRWDVPVGVAEGALNVAGRSISYSSNQRLQDTRWSELGLDVVVDCTGKFKSIEALQPYLEQGVNNVVVSAPISDDVLNVVVGVNDEQYNPKQHRLVTAASCTTNCIAPVISVLHQQFSIEHGSITTIHDITNTQSVLDSFHKDPRRARASGLSLIPTSTGSASAIADVIPELKGKLDGIAVRVPLANASLADCVFEVKSKVSAEVVNQALVQAAESHLRGILGVEDRPLVSVDYRGDLRSGVVDALSTRVVNDHQVKVLVWYDNETGYAQRMMELVTKAATAR